MAPPALATVSVPPQAPTTQATKTNTPTSQKDNLSKTLTTLTTLATSLKPRIDHLHTLPTGAPHGLSLLHIKTHSLLLYILHLLKLVQLKLNFQSISPSKIEGDDVVWDLIKLRTVLEKTSGLERGLGYQIERLVLLAGQDVQSIGKREKKRKGKGDGDMGEGGGNGIDSEEEEEEDSELLRPNVDAMVARREDREDAVGEGEDGVYRPPKIAAVDVEAGGTKSNAKDVIREERERAQLRDRARRSANVREMLDEMSGRPDVMFDDGLGGVIGGGFGGGDIEAAMKLRREDKERQKYEEETFRRIKVTKKEKMKRRELENRAKGFDEVEGGANEMLGIMELADRIEGNARERRNQRQEVLQAKQGLGVEDEGDSLQRMRRKRRRDRKTGGIRKGKSRMRKRR